jgi:RTX calcium-binding nonapeptide repeat (4 copies)
MAAAFVLSTAPGTVAAAPPQILGHNPISTEGGCTLCSAFQLGDSVSPNSYEAPSDGVLTRASFYIGPYTGGASEYVQMRTFRRTGGSNATVVSEGDKHFISGLSAGLHTYFERTPMVAGDVLGGRFATTPFIDGTPHIYTTASASDEAGVSAFPGPNLGDSFTGSAVSSHRVNASAVFEADDDGDGYGDTSQDLCPGSPHTTDACTGALFGSALQGPYLSVGHDCTYECLRVQIAVAGSPTAVPKDGVIVRWRLLAARPGTYRIRTIAPASGANYAVVGSSAVESVGPSTFGTITTFQTRLPIPAGGYVALVPPRFTIQTFREPSLPGSTYLTTNDAPDGGQVNVGGYTPLAGDVLYDADIEPDGDHDGFGDISQDSCATDPATQGACPAPLAGTPISKRSTERCNGKRATVVGTSRKDRLKGTPRADVIAGLAGDDTIKALGGNDLVCAGKGSDTVRGGPGRDRLLGESGVDQLFGGPDQDKLIGGTGKDLQRQ